MPDVCTSCNNYCLIAHPAEQNQRNNDFFAATDCGGYIQDVCPQFEEVIFKSISDEPKDSDKLTKDKNGKISWSLAANISRQNYKQFVLNLRLNELSK